MGHSDTYSSKTGVLSRALCRTDGDAQVHVQLSPAQLAEIGNMAVRSGFFSLPSQIPLEPDQSGVISVTAPCAHYALDIHSDGRLHRVWWSCNSVHNGVHPAEVRELYSAVTSALAEAVSELPESQCRYH
jgi:hypothetical protein